MRTVGDGVKLAGTKADLAVRRFAYLIWQEPVQVHICNRLHSLLEHINVYLMSAVQHTFWAVGDQGLK